MAEKKGHTQNEQDNVEPYFKIIEFYAGIGGFHYALNAACSFIGKRAAKIVASIDINTNTTSIYAHNFPSTLQLNKNICGMTAKELDKLGANVFFLSPPCQPFTRQGNQLDNQDRRTDSFFHLMHTIREMLNPPSYLLMENVKGFEESKTRGEFVGILCSLGYTVQEFLLNPNQFGIPNSRLRYYLLAKKKPLQFALFHHIEGCGNAMPLTDAQSLVKMVLFGKGVEFEDSSGTSLKAECGSSQSVQSSKQDNNSTQDRTDSVGGDYGLEPCKVLSHYLEEMHDDSLPPFLVPSKILSKYALALDIVQSSSLHSCCFTKGYGNYAVGTGSVLQHSLGEKEFTSCFHEFKISNGNVESLSDLNLRYFTPREVANLMCFPPHFSFPSHLTVKQCYMALGNSLNVKVVSFLISYLFM